MRLLAAFVFLFLFAGPAAVAQVAGTPVGSDRSAETPATADSTTPAVAAIRPVGPVKPAPLAHKFLDIKNSLAIATFGVALAGDSYSTQQALAYPNVRERNPVAQPFVSSRAGEIAYSGAGFALFAGGMYLAHRTGHHKIERIAPWIASSWEGFLAGWNWHQVALARGKR